MKKKLLSCALLMCAALAVQAQQKFTITGKLTELKEPQKIRLKYSTGGKTISDTTVVINGAFQFLGEVKDPVRAELQLLSDQQEQTTYRKTAGQEALERAKVRSFFVEEGKITISGRNNLKDAVIKGGKTQQEFQLLEKQLKPFQDQKDQAIQEWQQFLDEKYAAAKTNLGSKLSDAQWSTILEAAGKEFKTDKPNVQAEMTKVQEDFIRQYPDSYVSLDLMRSYASGMSPIIFEPLFNSLSQRLRNTDLARRLADKLANTKRVSIGQPFVDFALQNTEGKSVTLSSLKGKYLLLDFWASWCGPCRAENPKLLKAHNKFKHKNFDIVGLSLDEKKDAWLKAVKDDGMPWLHLIDQKAFEGVAKQYGITGIPQNFLLDPNGKIIARNLRGEDMEKKLAEILGN